MIYDEARIIQTLQDAGCGDECIREYLSQKNSGNEKQCDKILQQHRKSLLDRLHQEQKRIDCLDYYTYTKKK